MKSLFYIFLLFPILSLQAQDDTVIPPKIAMKIALGDSIQTDEMTIAFMEVLEDSRCPTDVICVWAGQAKVSVQLTTKAGLESTMELTIGKKGQDMLYANQDFKIRAVSLTPYPTTENMGKREYSLLIVKEIMN